ILRSVGIATPTDAAIRRCGSRVEFSLITTKVTWPGFSSFTPSLRGISLQRGGKMLDTRTRLHAAMPAERSASSKLVSFSRCFPTPLVRNILFGTNIFAVHPPSKLDTANRMVARNVSAGHASKVNAKSTKERRGCQRKLRLCLPGGQPG